MATATAAPSKAKHAKPKVGEQKMLIGGKWVNSISGKTFPTLDPTSGETICNVAEGDKADIDLAVKAAREAFERGPWSRMDPSERGRLLNKLADAVEANKNELAALESLDNGKPLVDALGADLPLSIKCYRYYGGSGNARTVSAGVLFWGAASTFLAMGVMQAAVLLEWPMWVSQASIAYYLLAWLGIMWVFLVVQRDRMSTVERGSTAIYFGAKFSCMAILPVQLWLHDGNPLYALPSFLVLVGLSIYFHGILYRGRYFLDGIVFFVVAAAFPLIAPKYWPGVYGLMLGGAQLVTGYHIYSESRRARAALRSETTHSIS